MNTRVWYALFAMLLVFAVHSESSAQAFTIERERVLANDGVSEPRVVELFPLEIGMGKVFEQAITRDGANSFRIHFQRLGPPSPTPVGLRVVDSTNKLVWSRQAGSDDEAEFWSSEIKGSTAKVQIYSVEDNSPLKFKIDRVLVSIPPVKPEAITPPNNLVTIVGQPATIVGWGRSVAKLRFVADSNGRQYVCTGFVVSQDLFLTNDHCIHTPSEARSAIVEFDYDSTLGQPVTRRLKQLVLGDAELDFALLRLDNNPGRAPLQLDLTPLPDGLPDGKDLIIIQHPGGDPKQVSKLGCVVRGKEIDGITSRLTDFGHLCDSIGGSSGSPVQDPTSGRVFGLHHLGFRPNSSRPVNQAVKIGLIVDFIRQRQPSLLIEMGIQ